MTKVFISYARKDGKDVAEFLHDRLSGCGFDLWADKYDLAVGDDFPGAISKALDEADVFIIVISQDALQSEWVNDEINMAMAARCRIMPVVFEGIDNDNIPLMIRTKNYVVTKGIQDWEALSKLVDGIDGGKDIPRVFSMSKQTNTNYKGVLLLGRSEKALELPQNSADMVAVAEYMWREYMLISEKIRHLGLIPPGYAPLASAVLAYIAGKPNQLPRIYFSVPDANNIHTVSNMDYIDPQELRKIAQAS